MKIVLVVRCRRRERVERGDVARLDDPELPSPVDRPLDVLRTAEVLLNARPESGELAELRIGQDVAAPLEDCAGSGVHDEVVGVH